MESPAQPRQQSLFQSWMMSIEIAEDFTDLKLPTLDIKIWINDGLIEFYEKPMGANIVLNAKTALGYQTKLSSLTQEVVRRLLHTIRRLESSSWIEALENLSQKMMHRPNYIKKVMMAGWMNYHAKLSCLPKTHPTYKPLHLGTKYDSFGRLKNKVMAKENWYKESQDQGQDKKRDQRKRKCQKDGVYSIHQEWHSDQSFDRNVGEKNASLVEDMAVIKRSQTAIKPTLCMSQVTVSATQRMERTIRL
jgi:hypothetical protein